MNGNLLTIELCDPLERKGHHVGMSFQYKQLLYSLPVQLSLDCLFSYSLGIHYMWLIQPHFDRSYVGMVSMVPNQLLNRNLVRISIDSDLSKVLPVGMCEYSVGRRHNL